MYHQCPYGYNSVILIVGQEETVPPGILIRHGRKAKVSVKIFLALFVSKRCGNLMPLVFLTEKYHVVGCNK